MARSELTAQTTSARSGLVVAYEAANADGNLVANNGRRVAVVFNGDSAAHTVTQVTGGTVAGGLDVADADVTVPAGATAVLGPWPPVFNQPGSNTVHLDYDAVTSLEVAAVEV